MIPAILVAVVMIAGVFAFMPVEKASTVHGTLATSSGQTTTQNTITGQDRAISFSFNMSHVPSNGDVNWPGNATIVLGQTGVTYTGYGSLTAIPNNATWFPHQAEDGTADTNANRDIECGFITTGQDGAETVNSALWNQLGGNATGGQTNFTRFSSAALTEGEGIAVQIANTTQAGTNGLGGICQGMIVLTNWGS